MSRNDVVQSTIRRVHIVSSLYTKTDEEAFEDPVYWLYEDESDNFLPFPSPQYAWQQSLNTFWDFVISGRFRELLIKALTQFRITELSVLGSYHIQDDMCPWGRAEELRKTGEDPCPARRLMWRWEPKYATMPTRIGAIVLDICNIMPIEELNLDRVQPCYLPTSVQGFIHLRSLSVSPIANGRTMALHLEPRYEHHLLCRLFGALPNLQDLTIGLMGFDYCEQLHAPVPNLRSLTIHTLRGEALGLRHLLSRSRDTLRKLRVDLFFAELESESYGRMTWINFFVDLKENFTLLSDISFNRDFDLTVILAPLPKRTEAGEKKDVATILDEYISKLKEIAIEQYEAEQEEDEEGMDAI